MSKDSISYNDILEKTTVFLDKVFEDIDKEIMYTVKKIEEYLVDSIIDDEYDVKMRRTRFREIPGYMFDSLEEEIKEYVTKAKATQEKLIESYNVFNYLIQNEKCEKNQ